MRAVLHELHRLRGDGRRAPRAAHDAGRGRLPPAAARGVGARAARRAPGWSLLCNPNNPTGTVYSPRRARDGRRVLPRPRPLPRRRRGLPRVRLRRPHATSRALARPASRTSSSSSTACRSATAPAASGSAASRRATARSTRRRCAWRRGGSRRPASRSSWRPAPLELGPDYFDQVVAEYRAPPRRPLRRADRDPGRLPAQARGRLLLRRPPAGRTTARTSRAGCSPTSPRAARR